MNDKHLQDKLATHIKTIGWRPTIRTYLILMNMIPLCILFPLVSVLFLNEQAKFRDSQLQNNLNQMRASLENSSKTLVRSISLSAGQAVAGFDFTFLNIIVDQVVSNDPEMIYCIVMDQKRKALAHSDSEKIGSILNGTFDYQAANMMTHDFPHLVPENKSVAEFLKNIKINYGSTDVNINKATIMEAVAPIYNGARLWGVLRCGYSLKRLHTARKAVEQDWALKMKEFKIFLASITGIFFLIGGLVAALFTQTFVKSMRVLNEGVKRVSEGNLEHEIEQQGLFYAEFVKLSEAFNVMTSKLKVSYNQLDEYSKSLEQKVFERTRELEAAQANLMQQAHEAGMAEMAVGILHNIGNAVTPAKVGISLLIRRLRENPLRNNLKAASQQIYQVVEKSEEIEPSEKTRLLTIIDLVPKSIKEELDRILSEIQQVKTKHDHIEGIISLQMRYARLFDDSETINIKHVTQDALKMLEESLIKRSIEVNTHFEEVPAIRFDKTKLIQIIVNLIKNGFEAMDQVQGGDKSLDISIYDEKGEKEYVVLSVKDGGVGFTAEEHDKMFTFGFTTKKKGTGFGLHSCANYLIANKGSITAKSEGIGKGAEFIVRLPV